MTAHLFGATSSPNFSLIQTVKDNSNLYNPETVETVKTNFYMDDCLKSIASETIELHLYHSLTDLLKQGGFLFTKLISNFENVLKQIPKAEKSTSALSLNKDVNLRVLGVKWDFISDNFQFDISVKERR